MTPIEGTQEQVNKLIVNQVCAEHGERVTAVWDPKASICLVRCAKGEYPARLKPVETRVEQYKRSTDVMVPEGMSQCPTKDIETGVVLSPAQIMALREFARRYGLDADRGHVFVLRNQPYIGLDGYYYHANKTKLPFAMGSRPLSAKDKALYQIPAHDFAWIAELEFLDNHTKVSGLGIVTKSEIDAMSVKHPDHKRSPVVAEHPQLQCQKRAEWQCMRRAFPIGGEDQGGAGDQGGTVTATVEPTPKNAEGRGEIIYGDHEEPYGKL